jgi:hypothetical protein
MSIIPFEHTLAAHCETGVMSAILKNKGLIISEPMVLGISGGIFFAYMKPKALETPTIVTRSIPGDIRKQIAKRLGVKFWAKKYGNPTKAQADLDALLARGIPTIVQTDVFYLDYTPNYARMHFNAHFITILGKENGVYTVSDVYEQKLETVKAEALARGRFAHGELAPKGLAFYPISVPVNPDLKKPIIAGIRSACFNMLKLPIPFIGIKGIRLLARKLPEYPSLIPDINKLSHETMMINIVLEERGTGGAGFRFMYASFLQEAAKVLNNPDLDLLSKQMMAIGDKWRELSLFAARIGKKRDLGVDRFKELAHLVNERADAEEAFFKKLSAVVR